MTKAHVAENDAPLVVVDMMLRYYLKCEICSLVPMFFGGGYATRLEADESARKHREAHVAQPYCTCATHPSLVWDDDDDEGEPDVGHGHCRHQGGCCECGCLTKRTPPGETA